MCQCALAQTGYFASMCLMSPTLQAPTVLLETARKRERESKGERERAREGVHLLLCEGEKDSNINTKYPGSLQLLCLSLWVNESLLEAKT